MHRDGASKAVEAAQSQARPSHGRSEQIASNCSKHVVGVGSNGETKGRKRSQRDGQNLQRFSTLGEVSRAYLGCGARGAGRLTCERDCTHREKLCAICVGAEQRYTNGCRAVDRGGTSKNSVVCRARQCAYVMRREPPCGQTASMHCSRVLSVVGCKSSVGNLCVFSCVTVRERAEFELFLN